MAYRRSTARRSRSNYSRAPRARTRRTYSSRGNRRVSGRSAGRQQTVRVVIEQAPASAVARQPLATAGVIQVEGPKPQKAKF